MKPLVKRKAALLFSGGVRDMMGRNARYPASLLGYPDIRTTRCQLSEEQRSPPGSQEVTGVAGGHGGRVGDVRVIPVAQIQTPWVIYSQLSDIPRSGGQGDKRETACSSDIDDRAKQGVTKPGKDNE